METSAQFFNRFATGARTATPDGEPAIETLQPGDRVVTHDGRAAPAIWRARQTVANLRGVELGRKPVRIDAGALGPNLPNRPLTVTADHALPFGDMLVNAGALAEDGTPIRFLPLSEMPTRFAWWRVELEEHRCVVANGGVPADRIASPRGTLLPSSFPPKILNHRSKTIDPIARRRIPRRNRPSVPACPRLNRAPLRRLPDT